MEEIFTGKADYFPGLLPLVYAYLDFINCDALTYSRVKQYLKFIEKYEPSKTVHNFIFLNFILFYRMFHRRATGRLITPAQWMRQFVHKHPAYQHDSIIRPEIAHDLMMTCKGIGEGTIPCPEILGDIVIDR